MNTVLDNITTYDSCNDLKINTYDDNIYLLEKESK